VEENNERFTVIDYFMSICNYILYDPEYSPNLKNVVAQMIFTLQNLIKHFRFEKHKQYRFHPVCHGKEKPVTDYRKDRFNQVINREAVMAAAAADAPDIYYPMNKRYI
jgi:hypothetical protein